MLERKARRNRRRGGSALEMALCMPWFVFLFVGAFDWGFYARALISVENAARVASLYTPGSSGTAADIGGACEYAKGELLITSNVDPNSTCNALPLIVTATAKGGAGQPASADGQPASEVSVTYRTQSLIPIPGVLKN